MCSLDMGDQRLAWSITISTHSMLCCIAVAFSTFTDQCPKLLVGQGETCRSEIAKSVHNLQDTCSNQRVQQSYAWQLNLSSTTTSSLNGKQANSYSGTTQTIRQRGHTKSRAYIKIHMENLLSISNSHVVMKKYTRCPS